MLNIMIVEDEPPIARSIKNMIESFGSAYSVTSTARNGKDALCQLEEAQQEIDVMFIDIQMPVMDGLTLMKEVSSQYPSIALVVLSGYKDFSYAKQALNCNAADYLLKPVSKDDLSAVLKVLDKKINTRKTNEFEQKIQLLLGGKSVEDLHFPHGCSHYVAALVCSGAFPSFSSDSWLPGRKLWQTIDLPLLLSDRCLPQTQVLSFPGKSCAEKIIVIFFSADSASLRQKAAEMHAWFISLFSFFKETKYPITMIVSDPLSDISQIEDTINQFRISLSKKLIPGMSQIMTTMDASVSIPPEKTFLADRENALKAAFISRKEEEFHTLLKSLFQFFEAFKYPQCLAEQVLNHLVLTCCCDELPNIRTNTLVLDINKAASHSLSYDDFYHNILFVFEQYLSFQEDTDFIISEHHSSKLMTDIEAYLQEHYAENITNTTLSKEFGLVSSYLSKLFKLHTGVTPQKYLTSLRIEHAKQKIEQNPKRLIKDIALEVGFNDPLYFSRIFRKETNYSPADYIKLCEQRRK